MRFTSPSLSGNDHLIAILVNQGSGPTAPYQTLVIRMSRESIVAVRTSKRQSR